ncbi:asparagine synthase (glutamine-hydrolyzing) [Wolinella succinogenes]|uniref:asparagine synthase (glutamine-hydrolyzing) n=1 Tax=Wolinella succinogenes TaxID=844 RepID=UPI002FC829C2
MLEKSNNGLWRLNRGEGVCGILGYLRKGSAGQSQLSCEQFNQILSKIAHRGPDHQDFVWFNEPEYQLYLGHVRLSIIDLDERASQPMLFKDRYLLVFNGEIYNYRELKEELLLQGYGFATQSDSEVLLAAYDFWGEACVEHFNGMWAFAIYDKKRHSLFCSRDRFGVKPFYFYENEEIFVFASEIKALLPFLKEAKLNPKVILPYLARGFLDGGSETFFDGVYRLEASSSLFYDLRGKQKSFQTYYSILLNPLSAKEREIPSSAKELLSLLRQSVSLRLRSDVRVGACLSGGLDSSGVAALASQQYDFGEKLVAIHAKSSLKESDESSYAIEVANHLGLDLHMVEPSFEDFCESLDDLFYTQEEPFGSTSMFMQYFVMKKAKELGCKVMLDGQGADEVFLGYEHYFHNIFKDLRDRKFFLENDFFKDLKTFRYTKEQILEELKKADDAGVAWDIIKNRGNICSRYLCREWLDSYIAPVKTIQEFQKREIFYNHLPSLLRYEDRDSMRFGIETRLPYLDYRIVEWVLALPTEVKFQQGYLKFALREALEISGLLPKSIVWRYNKMGFESPQKLWIDRYRFEMMKVIEDSEIIRDIFVKVDIRRDDFLWKLFSIAKWEKMFNVKL